MKSYTSIEQSKKLAKILPLESADFGWNVFVDDTTRILPIDDWDLTKNGDGNVKLYHAWSLAALLEVLKQHCERLETTVRINKNYNVFASGDGFTYRSFDEYPDGISNLIDACYELILKLHELRLWN